MFNITIDGVLFCQSLSLRLNPQGPEANKLFVNSAEVQNQWGLHSTVATCIKYTVHYACWKQGVENGYQKLFKGGLRNR
jgi:hypothetical protein